jgi:hypothetical protein
MRRLPTWMGTASRMWWPPIEVNGNDNAVSVFRNVSTLGNIAFASRVDFPGPIYGYKLAIGDMDGDGKLDVVFVSFATGQSVSVYRNTSTPGSITFASRTDFGLGGWGNGVAVGDLDGDGKPDVAAETQISSQLSLFRNLSTPGSFTSSSLGIAAGFRLGNESLRRCHRGSGWRRPAGHRLCQQQRRRHSVDLPECRSCGRTAGHHDRNRPIKRLHHRKHGNYSTVAAGGSIPLSYQWNFNGTNIARGDEYLAVHVTNVQLDQA